MFFIIHDENLLCKFSRFRFKFKYEMIKYVKMNSIPYSKGQFTLIVSKIK